MNQLEELFNDRLANHSVPPPAGSWERIATNLSKKNKTIAWIRWAAVFLIGALAISIITTQRSAPINILSDSKKISPPPDQPAKRKEPVATALSMPDKKVGEKVYKKRHAEIKAEVLTAAACPAVERAPVTESAKAEAAVAVQTVMQPAAESKVASRSMVITYTLDPVIEMATDVVVADAPKKGSSLEKVVKFARDVKNGDSSIGLRVVKEDLIAQSKKKSPTKTH